MNAVSVSSMVIFGARGVELGYAQLENRPNPCGVRVVQKQHRQGTRSRAEGHLHVPDDLVLKDSGAARFPSSVTLMSVESFVSHGAFLLVTEDAEDTSQLNICQNSQIFKPLNCLTFRTMEGATDA